MQDISSLTRDRPNASYVGGSMESQPLHCLENPDSSFKIKILAILDLKCEDVQSYELHSLSGVGRVVKWVYRNREVDCDPTRGLSSGQSSSQ